MKGRLCALMALAYVANVEAAPVAVGSDAVDIVYDAANFSFYREDDGHYAGSVIRTDIDFEALTLSVISNGVRLEFNGTMDLNDPTHGAADAQQPEMGYFQAPFSFTAKPGYKITGYTVTLIGSYYITDPAYGRVFIDNDVGEVYVGYSTGSFTRSFMVSGETAPLLAGGLEALSLVYEYEQYMGQVPVEVTEYVPDPDCFEEECPYIEVTTIEYQDYYEMQYDGGDATIRLSELTLVANVAPVPVPAAVWMFVPALAGLGALRRRANQPSK